MSRADRFTFHDKDLVFSNPRTWNPGDRVQIIDQSDAVAPVLDTFYDGTRGEHRIRVDFGKRWINCSHDPQFEGCADCDNDITPNEWVEVHGIEGRFIVLDAMEEDGIASVLVDLGPQWYSEDDVERGEIR